MNGFKSKVENRPEKPEEKQTPKDFDSVNNLK